MWFLVVGFIASEPDDAFKLLLCALERSILESDAAPKAAASVVSRISHTTQNVLAESPGRAISMESGHLGTENDHFIIRISLYTTESPRCSDSKTNSVLASFVRELDVLELGCQII